MRVSFLFLCSSFFGSSDYVIMTNTDVIVVVFFSQEAVSDGVDLTARGMEIGPPGNFGPQQYGKQRKKKFKKKIIQKVKYFFFEKSFWNFENLKKKVNFFKVFSWNSEKKFRKIKILLKMDISTKFSFFGIFWIFFSFIFRSLWCCDHRSRSRSAHRFDSGNKKKHFLEKNSEIRRKGGKFFSES